MNHLMIDIETLGRRPDAIITQIGAVFFDPMGMPGEYGESFKINIDIGSQKGRTVTTDTIQFWLGQPHETSGHIILSTNTLEDALKRFKTFINLVIREEGKFFFWANGAAFDFPILENAFEYCDMEVPWAYHQVNDLRTLRNLVHPKRSEEEYASSFACGEGLNKHDALDDCFQQIAMLQELLVDLNSYTIDSTLQGERDE